MLLDLAGDRLLQFRCDKRWARETATCKFSIQEPSQTLQQRLSRQDQHQPCLHFAGMDNTKSKVIVQISSTAVPESRLSEYLKDVQNNELRSYERAPGLDSVCLLQRAFVAYVEVVIMSIWRSERDLKRFSESWPFRDRTVSEYGGIQIEPRVYKLLMFCKGNMRDVEVE